MSESEKCRECNKEFSRADDEFYYSLFGIVDPPVKTCRGCVLNAHPDMQPDNAKKPEVHPTMEMMQPAVHILADYIEKHGEKLPPVNDLFIIVCMLNEMSYITSSLILRKLKQAVTTNPEIAGADSPSRLGLWLGNARMLHTHALMDLQACRDSMIGVMNNQPAADDKPPDDATLH